MKPAPTWRELLARLPDLVSDADGPLGPHDHEGALDERVHILDLLTVASTAGCYGAAAAYELVRRESYKMVRANLASRASMQQQHGCTCPRDGYGWRAITATGCPVHEARE